MGYAICYGICFGCSCRFAFNPLRVPSYKGEPICKSCIEYVNSEREAAGRALWPVASDAYEAVSEEELP